MERTKYKITLLLLILAVSEITASYRSEIYDSYISGNMAKWKQVMDRMAEEKSSDPAVIMELVNYQYGYIGWAIGIKKNDEARHYLELAEKNLDRAEKYPAYRSVINAYRSAFYGFRIGLNKVLAPFLGGKSLDAARKAIEQDDRNYLGYVQLGNAEFYMPAAFGGSKAEAIKYYTRAQEIMESDPRNTIGNWNYLSLLTVIAQSYLYTRQFEKSRSYLDRILEIEPGFAWVKNELYKELHDKMNSR